MNGMETRSAKRKKLLNLNAEDTSPTDHVGIQDRISDLPADVVNHILSFLPIKSVAKTSILSKRWRDVWYSFPDLDFTTANAIATALSPFVRKPRMGKEERSCFLKGSKYIDQIIGLLDKHSGIRVLKFRFVMSFSRLNSLIRGALRHDVQELDMEISTFDCFNLPRSVINCETLRVFRLKSLYPGFSFPPAEIMKRGFKSLCTLSLSGPILRQSSMLDLFTGSSFPSLKNLHFDACSMLWDLRIKCPRLEDLSIDRCHHMQDLEISVQKLERLRVTTCFTHSSRSRVKIDAPMLASILWSDNHVTDASLLQNLTSLQKARVEFFIRQGYLIPAKMKSALNFISGISHCQQSLTLESQCIEVLSNSRRFVAVPLSPFHKLKSLELFMTGFNERNIPTMAKIFENSPTIDTVVITICGYRPQEQRLWETWSFGEEMKYWESQIECFKSFSHHLKVVKLNGFTERVLDLSFVKFILEHGEVLQQVFLYPTVCTKQKDSLLREKFTSQIMGFSRASPDATIIIQ